MIQNDFWSGAGLPRDEAAAFAQYASIVTDIGENQYPEIPLPLGEDNQWILDLDAVTFKDDLEQRMGVPIPPLLAAGIQGYFYSSFGAGWQEISAACGWNFVAAEEFGRWVLPGGNAYMADAFWRKLAALEAKSLRGACPGQYVRAGCRVFDVRLRGPRVQVTYVDSQQQLHSLVAKRVVMACPKRVCKFAIHDLQVLDPEKLLAISQIAARPYLVVNVLLNHAIEAQFYDLFLLGDGDFPMTPEEVELNSEVTDVIAARFAQPNPAPRNVLTLYWPLPWPLAAFTLLAEDAWTCYAEKLVPQLEPMLALLGVPTTAIQQVRMTRWGHAMTLARPGLIADGVVNRLRRPIADRIYFAHHDNWALPAVETSLLEAHDVARRIEHDLY